MKYFLSLIFSLLVIFGCKKELQNTKKNQTNNKPQMAIVVHHKKTTTLQSETKEHLKNWKQYNEFQNFLSRYENISPNEALSNANELKTLIKEIKKKTPIKPLNSDAFHARINVLENEILRLFDMTLIASVSAKEVNLQIDKIYLIFGSVNAKINTVFMQNRYDKEINLNDFFTLDSSEIRTNIPKNQRSTKKRKKFFDLRED